MVVEYGSGGRRGCHHGGPWEHGIISWWATWVEVDVGEPQGGVAALGDQPGEPEKYKGTVDTCPSNISFQSHGH